MVVAMLDLFKLGLAMGLVFGLAACGRVNYDPSSRSDSGVSDMLLLDVRSDALSDMDVDGSAIDATDLGEEPAGILVAPTVGLATTENGGTDSFTVVLASAPTADVTIALSSSDTDEGTVSPSSLTFTSANWNAPQSVTVTGVDDSIRDGTQLYTVVTAAAVSSDLRYDGLDADDVSVSNIDDESPGITLSRTAGLVTTEAGGTDVFTVHLNVAPSADVTISLSSDATDEATVSPGLLTFTTLNWASPQTLTVTGVDDAIADGDADFTIVTADTLSADTDYNALDVPDVSGLNLDDETPAILVAPTAGLMTSEAGATAMFTVVLQSQPIEDVIIPVTSLDTGEGTLDVSTLTFTSTNWNVPQAVTATGVDDSVADGDQLYSVTLGPATSDDANYDMLSGDTVSITNTDDESAGFVVSPTSGLVTSEAGGTSSFTVVLRSQPTADVVFTVTSSDTTEGTVAPAMLTFTMSNWDTPQTVTVTGVEDVIADGDQAYQAVVHVSASSDDDYAMLSDRLVDILNTDNETAGITVNPTSGLVTSEAGGTATFTIVLNSQPTADVVISMVSDVPLEGNAAPGAVVFTMSDWNTPQTITVTGADDAIADGSRVYHIVTLAATSTDGDYNGLNPADVTVTNTDNDSVGVTVTPTSGLTTTEAGATATFTMVLTSQPTANVTFNLTSSDTTEGTVSPASVTFTMSNWSTPQTVTLTGVDDLIADGNVMYSIVTGAASSSDSAYNGVNPNDVTATNTDNDMASIVVMPTSGLVTTEAMATASFTVVLTAQPTSSVVISLMSSDTTEGTVSPASLTFTTGNWSTPQTVTITGVDDAIDDGNIAYSIITGTSVSGDIAYSGLAVSDVTVTNNDDDAVGITVTPTTGLVTTEAGGTASFTVVLASQPSDNVVIGLTSSNLLEGTVAPASLTFTTGNWSTPQMVTVTGVDDLAADGNIAYTIVTAAAASSDLAYSGINPSDVSVTNNDNDAPGVTVSPTSGLTTTEAGGTANFTIVLATMPSAGVTISLMSGDTTEGTVSPASVMFTTMNWSTPQMVTVTGVNDSIDDGDVAYSIVTGNAVSADPGYSGRVVSDVSVTNTDNDTAGVTVNPTSGLVTTELGGTDSFTVVLTSQPSAGVTISLTSSDTSEGTVSPASISFTTMNWNLPQFVTLSGVNDFVDDGNVAYTIVTGSATSADAAYNGMAVSDVSVTNTDNDSAGVTVSPTSGLMTSEAGGTAMFTIVLTSAPTASVSISLTSSNTSEGTVSPASVTFTTMNWSMAQTVTVTGVNDSIDDGDIAYTIVTGTTSSADPGYNARVVADVSVTNTDNDTANVLVAPTSGLTTTEAGGTTTFNIVLASQPTANVSVSLTSSDTTEGTVSPASVTFTNLDWNMTQTVTVTGVNDDLDDGDIAYTIVTGNGVSSDPNYSGRVVADVSVTNTDNDTAGVTVTPTSGLVTTEAGGMATFTIVLDTQPTNSVVVLIASDDSTEGTASPVSLNFTTMNWSTPQTVTITGVDDMLIDGDIAYTVVTSAASSGDGSYNGMAVSDVAATNTDDDVLPAVQQAYVKASNTGMTDWFGNAVTLSADGNTMAIGARGEASGATGIGGDQGDNSSVGAGAVYVYVRSAGVWAQQAYVKASNTGVVFGQSFGSSVALSADGNTMAVGSIGEASPATGIGGDQNGDSAASSGAVYVFTRSGSVWSQQAYVKASNTGVGDGFGVRVALAADGDTMAVAASGEASSATGIGGNQSDNSMPSAGATYVFTRSGSAWSQQAYVKASNTGSGDRFGTDVQLSADGNTMAVGAGREASNATGIGGTESNNAAMDAGAVYVFVRSGSVWSQQAYIKASNTNANDLFGERLAVSGDGDTLAVAAFAEDSNATGIGGDESNNSAASSGAVYVFTRSGTVWSQQAYVKASNTGGNDGFGSSVSLSTNGSTMVVGAYWEDSVATGVNGNQSDNTAADAGAVYVFTRSGSAWSQQAYVKASNAGSGDEFGGDLALSSDASTFVVGARYERSNATGIDGDGSDNSTSQAGAAYVFTR